MSIEPIQTKQQSAHPSPVASNSSTSTQPWHQGITQALHEAAIQGACQQYPAAFASYEKIVRVYTAQTKLQETNNQELRQVLEKIILDLCPLITRGTIPVDMKKSFKDLAVLAIDSTAQNRPDFLASPTLGGTIVLSLLLKLSAVAEMHNEAFELAHRWRPQDGEPGAPSPMVLRLLGMAVIANAESSGESSLIKKCLESALTETSQLPNTGWGFWNRLGFNYYIKEPPAEIILQRSLRGQAKIDTAMSIAVVCDRLTDQGAKAIGTNAQRIATQTANEVPSLATLATNLRFLADMEYWKERKLNLGSLADKCLGSL